MMGQISAVDFPSLVVDSDASHPLPPPPVSMSDASHPLPPHASLPLPVSMSDASHPLPRPAVSMSPDEGIIEDHDNSFEEDEGTDCLHNSFDDGILWSPIVLHPKPPSSNQGNKGGFIGGMDWGLSQILS